ncbi:hypothetical protein RvY_04320 [Ramazzottius varieornatus]|uniref:Uncharacterized protein n=1 Tax=Ramazzottius varieornatus TaxID=947166 RepID=A0A1D1V199_RAMVA|nr:hypothetical protein RvY_04320 [Ramazzottius varieornatus]
MALQLADYFFRQKSPQSFRKVVMIFKSVSLVWTDVPIGRLIREGGNPPPDGPACGIGGFLCPAPESPTIRDVSVGVVVTAVLLVITGGYTFVRSYRKPSLEYISQGD